MKKGLIFILILSGFAVLAQAQYKPEKGNFTTELQFSLFNINAKVDYDDEVTDISTGPFSMPGLRFRYFFNEKLALRATLGFDFGHDKTVRDIDETITDYYEKYVITGESTEKSCYNTFSIAPGLEYHFGKWERMSLYVGGELLFGVTTSKSKMDEKMEGLYYERPLYGGDYYPVGTVSMKNSIETKNCKREYDDWYGYGRYVQNAPMFFGVNALFGMDFYIYKGLYMGAEFGLGYTYNTYLKGSYKENSSITITSNGTSYTEENSYEQKAEDKITSGNFSVRYNPMIRLGWRF